MVKKKCILFSLLLTVLLLCGCGTKTWQPHWSDASPARPSEKAERALESAVEKYNTANDRKSLRASIAAFRAVLKIDPGNKKALTELANQYILLGTAYTVNRRDKLTYFQKATKYSELAMYTNRDFKKAADSGKKPWEAADTLVADDAPAMLFWVTALQYEFKEAMRLPGKIANVKWMRHGITFLDRIKQVAPDYGNGAVEFAYSICYCVLPEFIGGDEAKCIQYMEKSIARGNGYLLPRWGRGKYFHQVTGEIEPSLRDLEWVAGQSLSEYSDAYPWRVHFIEDAMAQLELIGK